MEGNNEELNDEYLQMMAELKKKKTKKSSKRTEDEAGAGAAENAEGAEAGEKKKSKKKTEGTGEEKEKKTKKKSKNDDESKEQNPVAGDESKAKSSSTQDDDDDDDDDDAGSDAERKKKVTPTVTTGDGPDAKMGKHSYRELLSLLYENLRANNPDLVTRKKAVLPPPQVQKGPTKTVWLNFPEICKIMKREPEHLFRFFLAELGTTGSIDGNERFTIKGKYEQKIIESLLKKYIASYVSCQSCRNVSTEIIKDAATRMSFMHCKSCGASRAVAAIQKGYVATGKGERAKTRMAE